MLWHEVQLPVISLQVEQRFGHC